MIILDLFLLYSPPLAIVITPQNKINATTIREIEINISWISKVTILYLFLNPYALTFYINICIQIVNF